MEVESAKAALKRCSSAPLIDAAGSASASASGRARASESAGPPSARARRFSASFSPLSPCGPRLTPRVSQLRQEECADVTNVREVAHERETHSAMQMSQSWEDLALVANGGPASPTRARFSPGVSPSPTRRSFATRRSLSPIAMRPSCLSPVGRPSGLVAAKRRFDLEDGPNAKRWRRSPDSSGDSPSGFTFRPVSPRAPSSAPPMPASGLARTTNGPS